EPKGSAMSMKLIEIANLTIAYEGVLALDNITFSVDAKDFLGIIGPNGAGKTTLFNCMLGLITNYKATIKFFKDDIKKSRQYLRKIGYVPQKPTFEKNFPATVSDEVGMSMSKDQEKDTVDE